MITRIESARNLRVVQARKLTQRKHRRQQNRFCAEGLQVLRAAVEALSRPTEARTVIPHEVFFCEELFAGESATSILHTLADAGAILLPVTAKVMDSLSSREQSQGLLATFTADRLVTSLIAWEPPKTSNAQLLVVLDQLQYPGNVGTLVRTADAVGATAVMFVEPSADPLDPKAVRASMGSIFSIPVLRADDPHILSCWSAARAVRWIAADPDGEASLWGTDHLEGSVGLLLGNEGSGLCPTLHRLASAHVHLPQPGRVDSLNVSIAGGVLMYEWLRRQGSLSRKPPAQAEGMSPTIPRAADSTFEPSAPA